MDSSGVDFARGLRPMLAVACLGLPRIGLATGSELAVIASLVARSPVGGLNQNPDALLAGLAGDA